MMNNFSNQKRWLLSLSHSRNLLFLLFLFNVCRCDNPTHCSNSHFVFALLCFYFIHLTNTFLFLRHFIPGNFSSPFMQMSNCWLSVPWDKLWQIQTSLETTVRRWFSPTPRTIATYSYCEKSSKLGVVSGKCLTRFETPIPFVRLQIAYTIIPVGL